MIKRLAKQIAVCAIITVCATLGKETQECNFEKECAMGNITQQLCERRHCCYLVRPDSSVTCYMKKTFQPETTTEGKTPPTEKYPDDAIYLPKDMRNELVQKENLTKAEAVELINRYEERMKNFTMRSEINWIYIFKKLITTHVRVIKSTLLEPLQFTSGTSIQLKQNWGITKNGNVRNITAVVVTEYPELIKIFIKEQNEKCGVQDKIYMENTPIISVKVYDDDWNVLSVPVSYSATGLNTTVFKHKDNISLSCTFLKEDRSNHDWFTDGCTLQSYTNSTISCFCNHTTKFSMLFVVAPFDFKVSSSHKNYISILEYCMESLSLLCLIVTFFVLTLVQRRRSKGSSISGMRAGERTVVHANFVVSLSFLHFTRLFSEIATRNYATCIMIAVLSHYLMISSGMWMLIEGVLLYLNVIVRSMKNTALGIHKYWTGWGIPAVVVIVSTGIGLSSNSYIGLDKKADECIGGDVSYNAIAPTPRLHEAYCWLTYEKNMIWAAAGPLVVIFSFNIFILAHTVVFIWRLNRKTGSMMPANYSSDNQQFWKTAKSIFVLFPILGVPWLIGFLINTQSPTINLVFQYIHVILNGLQGFFIFLLYCVVNRESRGIVSRVASNRWEQHKLSMSASNTFGRSTSGSRRRGRGKSISSSQIGGSEQNINMTRMGSQYSVYTSSMNRKQSSASASTSLSGCAQRINRIMPNTTDGNVQRQKPGYISGCSSSLPRMDQQESHIFLKRSGTISGITSIDHEIRKRYHNERYICKACKSGPCIHAINNVAGLKCNLVDRTEPVLIGYKRTSSLDNIVATVTSTHEIYHQNRWLRRMTAEEFKRFSAIPEEKRRSGINSIISVGSNEHLNRQPSSLIQQDIEMKVIKSQNRMVDVVVEEGYESSKEDSSEFISVENPSPVQSNTESDKITLDIGKSHTDKTTISTPEQNGSVHSLAELVK